MRRSLNVALHRLQATRSQGCYGIASRASSQVLACASLGARQSPRGDNDPPELTLGPLGAAVRLNWLVVKNRFKKSQANA